MVISERDGRTLRFEKCYLHDMMREGEINNPKLRALLLVWESAKEGWKLSGSFLARLKTLRVLDLSRAKFHGEKLPSDIGKLVHLRYLSLYKARFTHLPSSLRNLKLLLYLSLYVFSKTPIYVPNVLKDMRELKHLSLPGRMHEKTKLELGNLVNLESLEYFSTEHCYASDLHGMTRLETLSIYVKGKSGCNMETLSSSLHVSSFGEVLSEVSLGARAFAGKRIVCSGNGFPKLEHLVLTQQLELEEWKVEQGSMPRLHTLIISQCENLKELPHGLRTLYVLKRMSSCVNPPAQFPEDHAIDVDKFSYHLVAEGIPKPSYYDGASVRDVAEGYVEELTKRNMVISERDGRTLRFEKCYLHDMMREGEINNPKLRALLLVWESAKEGWKLSAPIYVPNVFKDMRELKYLSLPGRMHEKTKLELGNLVNLESLEYFSTEHCYVSELHGMTRLETLSIYVKGKSGCNMETLSSSLHVSRYLKELSIHDRRDHGLTGDAGEFVLDCVNLNKLNLSVYMPKLPDGQRFPCRLTSVTLSHCCLEEDPMPVLAKLLHLSEVSLVARAFAGKRIVCSGNGFPKLEHLVLTQQLELEEWKVEQGSMPRLHTLIISQCENLKELPHGLRLKILQQQQNTSVTLSHCCLEEDPMPVLAKLLHLSEVSLVARAFAGKRIVCSGNGFPKLEHLVLTQQLELEEWKVEQGSMPRLHTLIISQCENLKELPHGL
ncbi:hypothetical protein DY000_02029429, partial [Brassica cretica]